MNEIESFRDKVRELAKLGRPTVGFGLVEPDPAIVASLGRSAAYARIIIVGPRAIRHVSGFDVVVDERPEEKLAAMLAHDEVEGIVRGTIDDFKTIEAYERLSGEKHLIIPALLEDPKGRQFFIEPASNPEGWTKEERLVTAQNLSRFVAEWGIRPLIAVYAGVRHDTYASRKGERDGVVGTLNASYEDAEWIVANLARNGYGAKNWSIDLNVAVEAGYNIHIPVNGMVGNQIFRVLLLCGGKMLAGPRLGLSRPYEDNSRTEKDFDFHIQWLAALINKRKQNN